MSHIRRRLKSKQICKLSPMANYLLFAAHAHPLTFLQVGLAATTLLLLGFVMFMCASHTTTWRRVRTCCDSYAHEPVIHLNHEGMMGAPYDGSTNPSMFSREQSGVPVWQKNIIMGGKCQLPDFSGVIIYDSQGNIVTPTRNPRPLLTWK